jgi:hypothetical protein
MSLRILCSGHLVRYPLGGHSWHHLQYLIGFKKMGHQVFFFENYGWERSCYDPEQNDRTGDASYGIAYLKKILSRYGLEKNWCYLAEDGVAHGMSRQDLTDICSTADVYFNLSNINWIPELELCSRRVLVDTDPVFSQIGGFGLGSYSRYHVLFTYGENVHQPGCDMPDHGYRWLPTRQPVVLDCWPVTSGDPSKAFTSVMNWTNFGAKEYQGKKYGQKDQEFEPFFSLPKSVDQSMELAVAAPKQVRERMLAGGWRLANPKAVTADPWTYQKYIESSKAEFCVAKHAYVSTQCGWFSDRSTAYLAMGRPVVVQDTGFSRFLPASSGLLAYRNPTEAINRIQQVRDNYSNECKAARQTVESYFNSTIVLSELLENSL